MYADAVAAFAGVNRSLIEERQTRAADGPLVPSIVMPEPMVRVPESPLNEALVMLFSKLPPKTTEPVPLQVWAPTKFSVPYVELSAAPISIVPFNAKPSTRVTLAAKTVSMSRVPSKVTPSKVPP